MMKLRAAFVLIPLMMLVGCATAPTTPSVMALPGSSKNFDQFMADDALCRQFASGQVGSAAVSSGNDAAVKSATIGTVIGALAGAALGGRDGAAVGAGMGLLVGASAGSGQTRSSNYGSQRQYDQAYVQCMYSKGHKVPVQGGMTEARPTAVTPSAQSVAPPPPPPPGTPPPPPPTR